MCRCQYKNTICNSQDTVSLLEANHSTTGGPEKYNIYNIAEAQDKNLQITFMDMIEVLKELLLPSPSSRFVSVSWANMLLLKHTRTLQL